MVTEPRISAEMKQCIRDCEECAGICLETVQYCFQQGGRHAEPDHLNLLLACVEVCRTSVYLMRSGSDFHPQICGVCAQVCEACARGCEQFGDDEQMRRCAEVCRRCAGSCARMADHAGHSM